MRQTATKVLRFRRAYFENWRNFLRVDVELQRRVFLIGPNASGKSNFLDAFRFLRDLASEGGGFREAIGRRGGVTALRCLAARRYPDVVLLVNVAADDAGPTWEYELHITQDNQRRPKVRKERVAVNGRVILERPNWEDSQDPERLSQTHLEQVNANRDFRDLAEFFTSVRYLHVVPQLIREPDRSVGRINDPYGGDFLEQIARTQSRTRTARLRRIGDALRVAVPQLKEIVLVRDDRGTPHLRGRYEHWRPQGAWQTEDQFSDGTLRLLGLLWSLLDGYGPLLLEEPELSLHPEVIRYLPQLLARVQGRSARQVVLSTHSPEMLHDEGIGLNEVLVLEPQAEGTSVRPANDYEEVRYLLEGGISLADALLPRTRPDQVRQLQFFEES